jgi:ribose 5-phosphate isomerase A
MSDTRNAGKGAAARHAAGTIENGMRVGLGTGSTSTLFVRALGERVKAGLEVIGVPTSEGTAELARSLGIKVSTLEEHPKLDVDVDGADEVDAALDLVKGLGGALLREKIVAAASSRFVVIVGDDKLVERLGEAGVVPVEVVTFGWSRTQAALEALGARTTRRADKSNAAKPFVTDGGNYILDCRFAAPVNARALAPQIKSVTGVVDHGFFIGMASEVVVGSSNGDVRTVARTRGA